MKLKKITMIAAPPPMRPNPPSEGSAPRQRAGENDFYDPPRAFTGISRVHSTATVARTVPSLGALRESSSPAHRLSPGYTLPPMRPNPPSEGSAPRQRAGENDFYDPPRAFTGISRVHLTATVAHRVLARRVVLHANLRLPRVGFRPATQSASVRAKTTSTSPR